MRLVDNEKKNIISIAGELFCFNISEAIEVPGHEGGRFEVGGEMLWI